MIVLEKCCWGWPLSEISHLWLGTGTSRRVRICATNNLGCHFVARESKIAFSWSQYFRDNIHSRRCSILAVGVKLEQCGTADEMHLSAARFILVVGDISPTTPTCFILEFFASCFERRDYFGGPFVGCWSRWGIHVRRMSFEWDAACKVKPQNPKKRDSFLLKVNNSLRPMRRPNDIVS